MSRPSRLGFGLLVGAAGLIGGCGAGSGTSEIEFRVPVSAREVATGTVEDRVIATGTLRALESVALRAETTGSLVTGRNRSGRRLAEGDRVRAGQTVAEVTGLDVKLAARSDATLQRFEAAERDHEARKRLYEEGLLPEFEYNQAESVLADARLELERSQLTERRSRLVTPIDGIILQQARDEARLPLADGQLVLQGQLLVQVGATETLIADIDLVGPDVSRVVVGLEARVRHHAWEGRGFEGQLVRLAPSLNPRTRTLRGEVSIDNKEGLLKPGMFVEVTLISEQRIDVPVVSRDAVTERGGKKVVFVLNGQRVSKREVVLGLGDDRLVEVREGLEVGERVVVRGIETLTDGTRVRVSGA